MEGTTFLFGEVVSLIVHNEVHDRPFRQRRRLVVCAAPHDT